MRKLNSQKAEKTMRLKRKKSLVGLSPDSSSSCFVQRVWESKALRYKLFFLKALTKRLWKLTIKTKRL